MTSLKGFSAVYCDAGFFIALFSKKDRQHPKALKLFQGIKENNIEIFTNWFVVAEAMTLLHYQYGYTEALTFNNSLDAYNIKIPTESQLHQGIAIFNLFNKDKTISFTDALSYVLITTELRNIPAISFDKDFLSLGLTTIN